MGLFKKVTKAVSKPFKELGKGWWTEVRTPLAYTAAGAALGAGVGALAGVGGLAGSAGAGALAGAKTGALAGAALGGVQNMSDAQLRTARQAAAIEAATAEKQMQAAYNASLQADATPGQEQSQINEQLADEQDAARRRRAYSLTKTVNSGGLLGSFGSRNTLG